MSPRLFDDAEIAAFRAALDARLAAAAQDACPAGAELAAIIEPKAAAHAPCVEQVTKVASTPPPDGDVDALFEQRTPDVRTLDEVCGPTLEALVVSVAAYDRTCTPFPIGVRPMPGRMMSAIATWKFLAYRARWLVERSEAERGTTLFLALLHTAQDLARGRATLVSAMIGGAALELVIARAEPIIAQLPPAQLARFAAALDRALATGPVFAEMIGAERDWTEANFAMPGIDPTWQMPGGWEAERPGTATPPAEAAPRDAAALMFAYGAARARELQRACPATATLAACHAGFARRSQVTAPASAEAAWQQLARAPASELPRVRVQVREALVEGLLANDAMFADHVGKAAQRLARLAMLRAYVEVTRTGTCAVPDAIRAPARLGEALPFEIIDERLVLRPPPWIAGRAYTAAKPLVYELPCRD